MIIKEGNNIPASACEFEDFEFAFIMFLDFKGDETLSKSDFMTFLSTSSDERDAFYNIFQKNRVVVNDRYLKTILS